MEAAASEEQTSGTGGAQRTTGLGRAETKVRLKVLRFDRQVNKDRTEIDCGNRRTFLVHLDSEKDC
jgi:hypothetical protein